jgi:DNA-binding CsgD family transcriptional regulator
MLKLTPTLETVLKMTAQGHSQNDIAEAMQISKNTVKGYRRRLYRYFDLTGTDELRARFKTC